MKKYFLWFTGVIIGFGCGPRTENTGGSSPDLSEYYTRGKEVAAVAQQTFFQEVSEALAEGGTEYALQFMHPVDNPKIDSLDNLYQCTIGRTSNKIRNVANKPSGPEELALVEAYVAGKITGDTVIIRDQHPVFYQPILLSMPACLQCHGQPSVDITEETLDALRNLYPDDQATGYKLGDVRGLWKVTFRNGVE
ncbi:MAG: DUF3365 domain-containing protein [Saprospiraceae bacterium]|nr:DUF3365 domain-containing protein [Saprospiraceae bacterium]